MVSIDYYGLKKKLQKLGYRFYREGRGSHEVWYHPETDKTVILPNHGKKDMKKGTLNAIIKSTGLSTQDFWDL